MAGSTGGSAHEYQSNNVLHARIPSSWPAVRPGQDARTLAARRSWSDGRCGPSKSLSSSRPRKFPADVRQSCRSSSQARQVSAVCSGAPAVTPKTLDIVERGCRGWLKFPDSQRALDSPVVGGSTGRKVLTKGGVFSQYGSAIRFLERQT